MSCRWDVMNMRHRQLVAAGAKIVMDGSVVALPDRPGKEYPDSYLFDIEINPQRSYGGENLEEFNGKELTPPIIL